MEHYAEWGAIALRVLDIERTLPGPARDGRAFHHAWVARVFEPQLSRSKHPGRTRAQLVAVTDVYVWKVLHHDLGLPRPEVEATLVDLVNRVLA